MQTLLRNKMKRRIIAAFAIIYIFSSNYLVAFSSLSPSHPEEDISTTNKFIQLPQRNIRRGLNKEYGDNNDDDKTQQSCFTSNQACQFFNLFSNVTCPSTTEFCPSPQPPGDSPDATCVSVGKFCRQQFVCNYNAITDDCCGDCQSHVVNCCPQWCNSCVPASIRCDLYSFFARADSADRTTLLRFHTYYRSTLCMPNQLNYRCNDKTQATLFCKAYLGSDSIQTTETTPTPAPKISDDTTYYDDSLSISNTTALGAPTCIDQCIDVVSDPNYCPCLS